MKRITTMILVLLLTVSLASCKRLPQDYFENKSRDSVLDSTVLLETYIDHLKEYYEETYPSIEELYNIPSLENYVTVNPNKNKYNREEFVNYHLTDQRIILGRNDMSAVIYNVDEVFLFMKNKCLNLKEAEYCETDSKSLMFLMEDKALVVEYTKIDDQGSRAFVYQFSMETNQVVFELNASRKSNRTDEVLDTFEMSYKENEYEKSSMYSRTMGQTIEIKHDLMNDKFYRTVRSNGVFYFWYLANNEQYLINVKDEETNTLTNEDLEYFSYIKYHDNKIVYEYKSEDEEFFLNLQEIPGWDRIERNENSNTFSLYNSLEKIEGITVKPEFESGEYVYLETTNLFDLGLDLPFTLSTIQSKEDYIVENFFTIIEESGLQQPGS